MPFFTTNVSTNSAEVMLQASDSKDDYLLTVKWLIKLTDVNQINL
jgi:hypothetical protein